MYETRRTTRLAHSLNGLDDRETKKASKYIYDYKPSSQNTRQRMAEEKIKLWF